MNAGLIGTDTYLQEWTRTTRDCEDDLDKAANEEARKLESEYDRARLELLIAQSGVEEDQ
jgi:hypothetical protein